MEENNKKRIDIKLGKSDNDKNKGSITQCVAWVSTSIAVIAGIWITKDPSCLWAFILPAMCT